MTDLDKQLLEAAQAGDTRAVKDLIDRGTDVNAKNYWGHTALMLAARYGYTEIVKLLLEYGADANIQNTDSFSYEVRTLLKKVQSANNQTNNLNLPHSGGEEWKQGEIRDAGCHKNCIVMYVKYNPLHYYLNTSAGNPITFFPHRGVRSGWVDEL